MNNYKILYQKLLELKNQTEARCKDVDEEIDSNKKAKRNSEVEIEDLERNKSEKNNIYKILVNYKDFIKGQILMHFKASGAISGILLAIFAVAVVIKNIITKQFLWEDILVCIPAPIITSAILGIVSYKDHTKYNTGIYKEYNDQLYAFPTMINSLDKQIQCELDSKNYYENKLVDLNEIKEILDSDINLFNQYLEYIERRIPEAAYPCRHNEEAINEVYENDPKIQDIAKLVRSKKEY